MQYRAAGSWHMDQRQNILSCSAGKRCTCYDVSCGRASILAEVLTRSKSVLAYTVQPAPVLPLGRSASGDMLVFWHINEIAAVVSRRELRGPGDHGRLLLLLLLCRDFTVVVESPRTFFPQPPVLLITPNPLKHFPTT